MGAPSDFTLNLPAVPPPVFADKLPQQELERIYQAFEILRQRVAREVTETQELEDSLPGSYDPLGSADAAQAAAIAAAEAYTNAAIASAIATAETAWQAYADAVGAATLAAASAYTDAGDAATLASANLYTDTEIAAAIAAATTAWESYADAGDAATLATANTYTDTTIAANFASPPQLGNVAPNAVFATTLNATGNVVLGDAAGDTLTINAGTWTLPTAGFTATSAFGAAPAGSSTPNQFAFTASGDAGGGTTSVQAWFYGATYSGANAIATPTLYRNLLTVSTTGLTHGLALGNSATITLSGSSTITTGRVFQATYTLSSSGNVTTGDHFVAVAPTLSSTGAVTNLRGFVSRDLGHATLVTNAIGFDAENMTAALTLTAAYRGQVTASATRDKYNLYMSGSAKNYFAGNSLFGTTTDDGTNKLQVTGGTALTGAFAVTGDSSLTGRLTLTGTVAGGAAATLFIVQPTYTSSVTATQWGLRFVPTFTPNGASLNTLVGSTSELILNGNPTAPNITNWIQHLSRPFIQAGYTGVVTNLFSYYAQAPSITGTGTVTNFVAFRADDTSTGTSTNRGIRLSLTAGTGKHNLYIDGNALNYLAGALGVGASDPDTLLTLAAADVVTPQLSLRSQRAAILVGNMVGGIQFMSNDTNLTAPGVVTAGIHAVATEVHTAAALGTRLAFFTTAVGEAASAELIRFVGTPAQTQTFQLSGGAAGGAATIFSIGVGADCSLAISPKGAGDLRLGIATNKLGFFGVTAVVRAAAITQTFNTADRTHAARTSAALTDNTGGAVSTTLAAIVAGALYLQADMVAIKNALASLADQIAKNRADLADTAELVNSVVDDLQAYGLAA